MSLPSIYPSQDPASIAAAALMELQSQVPMPSLTVSQVPAVIPAFTAIDSQSQSQDKINEVALKNFKFKITVKSLKRLINNTNLPKENESYTYFNDLPLLDKFKIDVDLFHLHKLAINQNRIYVCTLEGIEDTPERRSINKNKKKIKEKVSEILKNNKNTTNNFRNFSQNEIEDILRMNTYNVKGKALNTLINNCSLPEDNEAYIYFKNIEFVLDCKSMKVNLFYFQQLIKNQKHISTREGRSIEAQLIYSHIRKFDAHLNNIFESKKRQEQFINDEQITKKTKIEQNFTVPDNIQLNLD